MNKTDWGFRALMAIIILLLLSAICLPGCAVLQPRSTPTVAPTPAVQLWQAAKSSNWLATASIIGIGAGIFIAFKGKEWGMGLVISCCVVLFMTLAVARFAWWMALCGLVGSVVILYVSILSKKRALVEIIKGGELFKKALKIAHTKPDAEIELFNGAQIEAQESKSTPILVEKIKTKLRVKGEIE